MALTENQYLFHYYSIPNWICKIILRWFLSDKNSEKYKLTNQTLKINEQTQNDSATPARPTHPLPVHFPFPQESINKWIKTFLIWTSCKSHVSVSKCKILSRKSLGFVTVRSQSHQSIYMLLCVTRKPVFRFLRTSIVQIGMRICSIWGH